MGIQYNAYSYQEFKYTLKFAYMLILSFMLTSHQDIVVGLNPSLIKLLPFIETKYDKNGYKNLDPLAIVTSNHGLENSPHLIQSSLNTSNKCYIFDTLRKPCGIYMISNFYITCTLYLIVPMIHTSSTHLVELGIWEVITKAIIYLT